MISLLRSHADDDSSVTAVLNAAEALSALEKQSFSLYILDSRLPEISGIELCQMIRRKDKHTPIIFFTAMARPSDRVAGMTAGAGEYLVKPNDLEKLTDTVKGRLKRN